MGQFNYDKTKNQYVLDENTETPLWRSVPSKSFVGLGFKKELNESNKYEEHDEQDNFTSRVSRKTKHLNFIYYHSRRLVMDLFTKCYNIQQISHMIPYPNSLSNHI